MVNVSKAIINHLYIYFIVFYNPFMVNLGGRLTIALLTLYIAFAFNQLTPIRGHICRGDGFGAPGLESHWEPARSDAQKRRRCKTW